MRTIKTLLLLFILFISCRITTASPLFWDDFEGGLHGDYIIANAGGEGKWEAVVVDGNGVYKGTAPEGCTTYATVDGVASMKEYDEIWATVKFKSENAAGSSDAELGVLSNPDNPFEGNWYFATETGSSEVGIDESWIAWHNRVPYPDWKFGQWYTMKIALIDGILHGKIWVVGKEEPADWITSAKLTSHLDEDGIGLSTYQETTYYDDLIVASSENSLAMAVSSREKLATTWAKIKAAY